MFLARLANNENTPPLIYLLIAWLPSYAPAWLRIWSVVPGVLLSLVLYGMLRARVGNRAPLLAALAVAVDPDLVTYSNLARGFMLADLALLVATWSLMSLSQRESPSRWVAFTAAGIVAAYSEYGSIIYLAALVIVTGWRGHVARRRLGAAATVIALSIAAWIPEIIRGQDQVGRTKLDPLSATPSLTAIRDLLTSLAFGENGGTGNSAARWLLAGAIILVALIAARLLHARWPTETRVTRDTVELLVAVAALTVVGYALAAIVGVDVFTQRYLTILVPLAAAVGATAAARAATPICALVAAALVILGIGNTIRRIGTEWEPSTAPVGAYAASVHPREVLTNTPVVLYYLRQLHARFDRPYNLGPGLSASCTRPCLVIDDTRVHGGTARHVTGTSQLIGPFFTTLETR